MFKPIPIYNLPNVIAHILINHTINKNPIYVVFYLIPKSGKLYHKIQTDNQKEIITILFYSSNYNTWNVFKSLDITFKKN